MIALLTGYKGFIGQNLKEELKRIGYNVYGIEKTDVKKYLDNLDLFEGYVKECDIIFHVGAISDTSVQDYHEMLYYNYHFTKVLVDLCKKHDKRIIYSSSASVYGDGNANDVPNNIYAWSKLLGEEYGRLSYPEGFVSLRYFNVYGPHEEHKLENKMCSIGYQAYVLNDTFKLFPKKPTRDFVYVKDVVSANICAIDSPTGIYDVGFGESKSFEDFLDNMGNIPYIYVDENKIPSWYQFYTKANVEARMPGWEPKYNLERGCADYLNYLNGKES